MKQQIWIPTSDDNYGAYDLHTPSLVPVFDPDFAPTASSAAAAKPVPVLTVAITPPSATINTPQHVAPSTTLPTLRPPHNNDMTPREDCTSFDSDFGATDFHDWKGWSAPRRIAAVRRWLVHAAHRYGPVEHWAEDFGDQWTTMRLGGATEIHGWVDGVKRRIKMGRRALSYLEQAMEGELLGSVDEWRDLYAQSQQLACQLWTAVLSIQYKLNSVTLGLAPLETSLDLSERM